MAKLISAQEAASRMGVKVETLYAYVSRGIVESHPGPGRTRQFESRAIDVLARRGRPRQSSRNTSLNLLIETHLTSLAADGVRYRGHPSRELATTGPFEEVAALLWGTEPTTRPWIGEDIPLPSNVGHAAAIRIIVANLLATGTDADGLTANDVARAGRHLIASVVDSLPIISASPIATLHLLDGTRIRRSIAGRLWGKLSTQLPTKQLVLTLNAALVLLADHELAASTLGVRVAASARANPYAIVSTGLGVLSGALHGGASRPSRALMEDALNRGAVTAVSSLLNAGQLAPGFGHKVYVGIDPRAAVLFDLLRSTPSASHVMAVADDVCAEVRQRVEREPNVDFALAVFTHVAGMTPDAAEAIMAISRMSGWLAHAIEEYLEPPLRFRPRALYLGP